MPFTLGYWQGVDGSRVLACPNARSYRSKFSGDLRGEVSVIDDVAKNAFEGGLPYAQHLYGTGDVGGAPTEESVQSVCASAAENGQKDFDVISAQSDQIFKDIDALPDSDKDRLPVWNNELLMTSHGAGGYTARAMGKRLNRQCEVLADVAESTLSTAELLGVYTYPQETVTKAWERLIQHQFHDDLPGTSNMDIYNTGWNDYHTSLVQLQGEYTGAVGAIANQLDTQWVTDCALIVHNPLPFARTESVEAHVRLNHNGKYLRVLDRDGNELPSQVIRKEGKAFHMAVLATVPPMGYLVLDVTAANAPCPVKTDLRCGEHMLENRKYRLLLNKNGDIAFLYDKELGRQILEKPIKLAVLHDTGELNYPAWEMRKADIDKAPYLYANTPKFELLESGPAKAAIKVSRQLGVSKVEQVISLDAGSSCIRVENAVDWRSRRSMLKAEFPFVAAANGADYDLGLGVIHRGNNNEKLYEVPAQKWADLTDSNGDFGVSVFSDSKYGWDKPDDHTLRLTCLHTPAGAFIKEARQDLMDLGRNRFGFGIYSHKGGWQTGTQTAAEAFSKPLVAFQTSARKDGKLGSAFSAAALNTENALLRAFKKSEDGSGYIVRVGEAAGQAQKAVTFSVYRPIAGATLCTADERPIQAIEIQNGQLTFDLKPFEVKTFLLTFEAEKLPREKFKKMELPVNTKGLTTDEDMRNCILQGAGFSLPAELLPQVPTYKGITFKLPQVSDGNDLLVARGETLELPKGCTKLYFLAASTAGDRQAEFATDRRTKTLTIHSMAELPFLWDMAGLKQTARIKDADIALEFTHCHHPEGNIAAKKAWFYLYELDIRGAKTLTLPEDNRLIIMAMTAVKKYANTTLATSLLDTITGDYDFDDIPPMEKLIDKADFVTIRAGKIQDQAKGGKGKGWKRDNPITNIIRSYTKSEW